MNWLLILAFWATFRIHLFFLSTCRARDTLKRANSEWISFYLDLSIVVVRLFQFEYDLVLLQAFFFQFLDLFSIQKDLFTNIVWAESCACFLQSMVKALIWLKLYIATTTGYWTTVLGLKTTWASTRIPRARSCVVVLIARVEVRFLHWTYIIIRISFSIIFSFFSSY